LNNLKAKLRKYIDILKGYLKILKRHVRLIKNKSLHLKKKDYFVISGVIILIIISLDISTHHIITKADNSNLKITLKASNTTDSKITLKWNKVNMTNYCVYSYNQSSKKYTRLGDTDNAYYTVKNLTSSKQYYFAVRGYKYNKSTKKYTFTSYSNICKCITRPKKVDNIRVLKSSKDNMYLYYNDQKNISSYEIYSYDDSNNAFNLVDSTKNTSLTVPKSQADYYIKAAASFDNKKYYSEQSYKIQSNTFPDKVTNTKVSDIKTNVATITWNKTNKATKYSIYRYNTKTKKSKYIGSTLFRNIKVKTLKANTSYYLKIRGIKQGNGISYYGDATDIKFTTKVQSNAKTTTKTTTTKTTSPTPDTNFDTDLEIVENPSYVLNTSLAVPKISITRTKVKQIQLTWKKLSNVDGYIVYKYDSSTNTYKAYKKLTTTYFYDNNISYYQNLKYKVRAYKNTTDCIYIGNFSNIASLFSGSFGIDVSRWQGNIDWKKVKASGVEFAIIATTKRSSTSSNAHLIKDQKFDQNIKGALANGIKVGIYSYSIADSVAEAKKEADLVLNIIKGYKITYPVAFDYEKKESIQKRTKSQNAAIIKAFCNKIKNAGYKPSLYSGAWILSNLVDYSQIKQYDLWVANYIRDSKKNCKKYTFPNNITQMQKDVLKKCNSGSYTAIKDNDVLMWQFSECGKVAGINDNRVDLNFCYKKP